jgi:hypothetical protein
MSTELWQDTIDKMVKYLGLENPPKAEELFTNEFIAEDGPFVQ